MAIIDYFLEFDDYRSQEGVFALAICVSYYAVAVVKTFMASMCARTGEVAFPRGLLF